MGLFLILLDYKKNKKRKGYLLKNKFLINKVKYYEKRKNVRGGGYLNYLIEILRTLIK